MWNVLFPAMFFKQGMKFYIENDIYNIKLEENKNRYIYSSKIVLRNLIHDSFIKRARFEEQN